MRQSLRRLASAASSSSSSSSSSPFRPAPLALLPPIPLYRRLLRAHRRHLPSSMRVLGDNYVRAEFRAHRDVENPVHLVNPPLPPLTLPSPFFFSCCYYFC